MTRTETPAAMQTTFVRILGLLSFVFALSGAAFCQQTLTVEQIFHQQDLLAEPPDNLAWSPDGAKLIYQTDDGDLMELEGETGSQQVLLSREKMRRYTDVKMSERNRDERQRYHQPLYIWAPDSRHILFDAAGQLWYYDTVSGDSRLLADSGEGSGDDPQFSPDGSSLSFLKQGDLYAYMLGNSKVLRLTDSGGGPITNGAVDWLYKEELDGRSNYAWAPDSRHLAYLQTNETHVPVYPIEDWIPVHSTVFDQHYPQPGDPNPVVRVGVVGSAGGGTQWLNVPIDSGNDYMPRLGWVNSGTVWVETLSRNHKNLRLYFADITGGDAKLVLTVSDDKFLDESYDMTVTDHNILLTSWKDGHNHIYLYDLNGSGASISASRPRQLTSGNWEVSRIAGIDSSKQTIYYLSNEGDPRQQQLWAVGLDGAGKHKVSSAGGWHDVTFSPSGKYFTDAVSSITTPPIVNLCHNETACKPFWTPPHAGLEMIQQIHLIHPIPLKLKAADGATTLYGSLILPRDKTAPGSVPLILNPYGGPHVQTVTDQWGPRTLLFDQVLAEHGFAVLHVDNRGMGGRGRDFAQAAFHDMGPVQLSDQLAALDQVLAKYPQLDRHRLGWWGWSWGGSFTLFAMTHSDRFRAGVAVAPVTDWRDYDSTYTERYLGQPATDADAYRLDSAVTSAANLKGRILIAHGTGDDNVHFENTIQFIQQLIQANLPYDLQLYPRKTHSIAGPEARTHLYTRILWQFETHLMHPDAKN